MAWTSRDLDPQMLSAALLSTMQDVLGKASNIVPSQDPAVEATDIVEYDGRMRAAGLEKLKNTCYMAAINFYTTQAEADKHIKTKGALVVYLETENASKFFKALELKFADDEDDASMMSACGQFCQVVADGLTKELSDRGYAPLVLSKPRNYKNSIAEGVEYNTEQKTKHELSFFYFKHKAIVVELSLAPIPKK